MRYTALWLTIVGLIVLSYCLGRQSGYHDGADVASYRSSVTQAVRDMEQICRIRGRA